MAIIACYFWTIASLDLQFYRARCQHLTERIYELQTEMIEREKIKIKKCEERGSIIN
jgi:hypothetical protein